MGRILCRLLYTHLALRDFYSFFLLYARLQNHVRRSNTKLWKKILIAVTQSSSSMSNSLLILLLSGLPLSSTAGL